MFQTIFSQLLQDRKTKAADIAKQTGISTGLLSDYKNGRKTPSSENLQKIADFFGVSTDYLLGRDPGIKKDPADETAGLEELLQNPDLKAAYEKLVKLGPAELEIANAQIDLILKLREKREAKDTHHA